jgi:uncharacterized membrane protein YkvA (DUF1232 family)
MSTDHTAQWNDEGEATRAGVRRDFWRKARRVASRIPFMEDLLAAYYCAFDRDTPRHVQAALIGALAYFVLPVDVLPDMMLALGFTDDMAVLAGVLRAMSAYIKQEHRDAARAALARGLDDDA